MKKTLTIIMAGLLAVLLVTGSAGAITYNFLDTTINWPGWTPGYTQDQIGGPDIFNPPVIGMSVTVDDTSHALLSVVMHMSGRQNIVDYALSPSSLSFDALFINTGGAYQAWNYYVEDIDGANGADGLSGATLYSVDSSAYTYKLATPPWSPLDGRWGHPAGIATGLTPTTGLLTGVVWDGPANTLTYSFNPGITLSSNFQIGYSEWCANDVIITPEPGVMLLLGLGLVGIAVLRRKFNK